MSSLEESFFRKRANSSKSCILSRFFKTNRKGETQQANKKKTK